MILGYTRISMFEKDEYRTLQEDAIRAVAAERGTRAFDFSLYHDECASTSPLRNRKNGAALVKEMKSGDIVVANSIDRLFVHAADARDTASLWRENGIELIICQLGHEVILNTGMFIALARNFAEMERLKFEALHEARMALVKQGRHFGGYPPYGYRPTDDGEHPMLEPEPAEQEIISLVKKLYFEEFHGPQYITKEFERRGLKNRAGGRFQYVQIQRIVEKIRAADRSRT